MRMAPKWRRRCIAISGATAVVAFGVWAAVAMAAVTLTAPSLASNP